MKFRITFWISILILLLLAGDASASAKVAPYIGNTSMATDATFYGAPAGVDVIAVGHANRIMQTGYITHIRIKMSNVNQLTDFRFRVWSRNTTTGLAAVRSQSENLVPVIQNGTFNITFSTPLYAAEGDYFGLKLVGSGDENYKIVYSNLSSELNLSTTRYETGKSTSNEDFFSWYAYGVSIGIEVYMDDVDVVFIGDSLFSGTPTNVAFTKQPNELFISNVNVTIPDTIEYKLGALSGLSYQNCGIHGDIYPNLYDRYKADVLDKHPTYVVLEGGLNNFNIDATAEDIFNYRKQEITDAQNASIYPIVFLTIPCYGYLTAEQNLRSTEFNNMIIAYHEQNPNFSIVDTREALGTNDTNNGWMLDVAYQAYDGVHLNPAGNAIVASGIYQQAILNFVDSKWISITAKNGDDGTNSLKFMDVRSNNITASTTQSDYGSILSTISDGYSVAGILAIVLGAVLLFRVFRW
jgi:lysophospholipase L1-like esterase